MALIIVLLVAYAHARKMPIGEIIPLVLTAVLASIPVALPATFTLAAAVGAKALARLGVLPTRLSAVDEAATLDVLCSDKTGTLTRNELAVTAIRPEPGFDEARVLAMAALASSEGGQDPVDTAIRSAAARKEHRRSAKVDQVRSIRSSDKNVRGDSGGCERRHAACREGGVCGGHQTDRTSANSGRRGARTRREGIPGSGRCCGHTDDDAACGNHRAERSSLARMRPS